MGTPLNEQEELRLAASLRGKSKWEQADGESKGHRGGWHAYLKRQKRRHERHKAKRFPECVPTYNKFHGYET